MRKSAIEQVRLEGFAAGFDAAQNAAAYRFGALAYEQANKAMITDAAVAKQNLADHIREHGEWVA